MLYLYLKSYNICDLQHHGTEFFTVKLSGADCSFDCFEVCGVGG